MWILNQLCICSCISIVSLEQETGRETMLAKRMSEWREPGLTVTQSIEVYNTTERTEWNETEYTVKSSEQNRTEQKMKSREREREKSRTKKETANYPVRRTIKSWNKIRVSVVIVSLAATEGMAVKWIFLLIRLHLYTRVVYLNLHSHNMHTFFVSLSFLFTQST